MPLNWLRDSVRVNAGFDIGVDVCYIDTLFIYTTRGGIDAIAPAGSKQICGSGPVSA